MKFFYPLLFILLCKTVYATEWHVTLAGKDYDYSTPYSPGKEGTGTESHPWSLQFALSNPADPRRSQEKKNWILPGDIVWVHEGSYRGWTMHKKIKLSPKDTVGCHSRNCFSSLDAEFDIPRCYVSKLEGDSLRPIVVRAWQDGKVAFDGEYIFDRLKYKACVYCPLKEHISALEPKQILLVWGKFTTFWGFEFTVSNTSHLDPYKFEKNFTVADTLNYYHNGTAVVIEARGTRLLNLVMYSIPGLGIGDFSQNKMSETQGCLIFNNGYSSKDGGWGHAYYVANEDKTWKIFCNNILFNQLGLGIQVYKNSRELGTMRNIRLENNIAFNNGILFEMPMKKDREYGSPNLFIGGHGSKEDIIIRNNHCYRNMYTPGFDSGSIYFNIELHADQAMDTNRRIIFENNVVTGGFPSLHTDNFRFSRIRNNYITGSISNVDGYDLQPMLARLLDFYVPEPAGISPIYKNRKLGLDWKNNNYLCIDDSRLHKSMNFKPFQFRFNNHSKVSPYTGELNLEFPEWQQLGLDASGSRLRYVDRTKESRQLMNEVYIIDNDDKNYCPGRKHIVVYNLDNKYTPQSGRKGPNLTPYLKNFIQEGSTYRLRDVENYHSANKNFNRAGIFSPSTSIEPDLSPNQEIELPRMPDGKIRIGIRPTHHTAPFFAVYTLDFFPYEVEIRKEAAANGKMRLTAVVKPKGEFFYTERFSYEWEGVSDKDKNSPQITIESGKTENIRLKVTDEISGMSLVKNVAVK